MFDDQGLNEFIEYYKQKHENWAQKEFNKSKSDKQKKEKSSTPQKTVSEQKTHKKTKSATQLRQRQSISFANQNAFKRLDINQSSEKGTLSKISDSNLLSTIKTESFYEPKILKSSSSIQGDLSMRYMQRDISNRVLHVKSLSNLLPQNNMSDSKKSMKHQLLLNQSSNRENNSPEQIQILTKHSSQNNLSSRKPSSQQFVDRINNKTNEIQTNQEAKIVNDQILEEEAVIFQFTLDFYSNPQYQVQDLCQKWFSITNGHSVTSEILLKHTKDSTFIQALINQQKVTLASIGLLQRIFSLQSQNQNIIFNKVFIAIHQSYLALMEIYVRQTQTDQYFILTVESINVLRNQKKFTDQQSSYNIVRQNNLIILGLVRQLINQTPIKLPRSLTQIIKELEIMSLQEILSGLKPALQKMNQNINQNQDSLRVSNTNKMDDVASSFRPSIIDNKPVIKVDLFQFAKCSMFDDQMMMTSTEQNSIAPSPQPQILNQLQLQIANAINTTAINTPKPEQLDISMNKYHPERICISSISLTSSQFQQSPTQMEKFQSLMLKQESDVYSQINLSSSEKISDSKKTQEEEEEELQVDDNSDHCKDEAIREKYALNLSPIEEEDLQIFNLNVHYRDIYEIAKFYEEKNQEIDEDTFQPDEQEKQLSVRVSIPQEIENSIHLESEEDEDEQLPEVNPPYLPSKTQNCKDYTLVLDLDETLIHFDEEQNEDGETEVFYMVRPGLNKFLTELSEYYEIVIYTAALQSYADWIINQVDTKKSISHRLYRQHTKKENNYAIKDLRLIGRELSKTIIIDNIMENFGNTTPDNGIQIESWYDDLEDRELEKHLIFLKEIAQREVYDVREILKKYKDNMSGLYSKGLSMIAQL